MTDYALNLDAPEDLSPDPLAPLADYLVPHERDLVLMVALRVFRHGNHVGRTPPKCWPIPCRRVGGEVGE